MNMWPIADSPFAIARLGAPELEVPNLITEPHHHTHHCHNQKKQKSPTSTITITTPLRPSDTSTSTPLGYYECETITKSQSVKEKKNSYSSSCMRTTPNCACIFSHVYDSCGVCMHACLLPVVVIIYSRISPSSSSL